MNNLDFLSVYPQVYVGNKERAKNKFGGFLSSMYVLIMLGVFIYYIIIYFLGEDFKIKYFRKNIASSLSEFSEFEDLDNKEIELFLNFDQEINDCRIHPFFNKKNSIYDESNITKCNENLDIDPNGSLYCFNFSFFDALVFAFSGNCSKEDGDPFEIHFEIMTTNYKIDHKRQYPFQKSKRSIYNLTSYRFFIFTSNNTYYRDYAKFTAITYKSKKIFSRNTDTFQELYLSNINTLTYTGMNNAKIRNNKIMNLFYSFQMINELAYDVYEREYISLLDTLSK